MIFSVRRAEVRDIPQMHLLLANLFSIESDFTPDAIKQERGLSILLRADSAVVLVAEQDREVIGMCSLQTLVSTAEGKEVGLLEDLVVHKDFRRIGVGSALLKGIKGWSRKKRLSRIQLLRDFENQEARDFYISQGFQCTKLVCMRKLV